VNMSRIRNKAAILRECSRRFLKVENMPFYYGIHLNVSCNQKCIMCAPKGQHSKEVLPFGEFVELFDRIKPYAEHITLIGGEPLLYPWISKIIDLLSHHQIAVTINTNATMLNEALAKKLLLLHELDLKCSIDVASAGTYFRIRGTKMFKRVVENLAVFSRLVENRNNMKQILVYVVMRENMHEVLPFIDFAETLSPYRIEFHPVRHRSTWLVNNGTGWVFDGKTQSCEFFTKEYNDLMRRAVIKCREKGIDCEIFFVKNNRE